MFFGASLNLENTYMKISAKYSYLFLILHILVSTSCSKMEKQNSPIEAVPFTSVNITDEFWSQKIRTNREVTIPIAIEQCYSTGRVNNFKIAGGLMEGKYQTQMPFDDTDIYKLIEAASYSLQNIPDPILEARLDTLITYVGLAQEDDGYLYTGRTIDPAHPHPWADSVRWLGAAKGFYGSHELYNCGHLFEAATAHYAATGKRSFLEVAIKTADLLVKDFGPGKLEFGPGHQVVEMGLVKMYRATGKKEYLELSKFFLDVRGPGGEEYSQAHQKVIDQREPVGHAVRATYMYSAMADIANLYQDTTYTHALEAIWNDLVSKKIYVTGGIGSGGGNEGFDEAYKLPNMAAYCETCASVGNIYWNQRMFLNDGTAKYVDVLERTLYNGFLSGVSLSGDRFFYPNVLESIGQHQRGKWFGTACCPPNVARTLPSVPGYVYAKDANGIYVNLYIANEAKIDIKGKEIAITQQTKYPWEGDVKITVNPAENTKFELHLRIPGWAHNQVLPSDLYSFVDGLGAKYEISVNGEKVDIAENDGYVVISRKWKTADEVQISFNMEPRIIEANEKVAADQGKIAVQRGPILYTAEWPDVKDGKVLSLIFDKSQKFTSEYKADFLGGVTVVKGKAKSVQAAQGGGVTYGEQQEINLIPYYSWNNRGAGEMMVWLPVSEDHVRPMPLPSIASNSKVSGSRDNKTIVSVNDQLLPENSIDHNWPFYHWWPINNSWQWIQYDFEGESTISSSDVYWFDDQPFGGCAVPDAWELEYKKGNQWIPIKADYPIVKDGWSKTTFKPIKATGLRLKVKLSEKLSAGVHEWVVN
jgi:uncharacterized protein